MKANIHNADKAVRISVAIVVAALYFTGVISGTTAVILSIIATVLVVTAFINFCPIYHFLGISTKKNNSTTKE